MEITKVYRVTELKNTVDDWQLFSNMKGADKVATLLNSKFVVAVNSGKTREQVRTLVESRMSEYSAFGARDTEPRGVLEDLLDEVFGE